PRGPHAAGARVGADCHARVRLRRAGHPRRRPAGYRAGPPGRRRESDPGAPALASGARKMIGAPGSRGEARAAWLFLTPALILLTVFFFLPVLTGLALSLTDFDLYAIGHPQNVRLVGAANYRALAQAPMFWSALKNTLYFAFVGAPLSVLAALV